jgi:hypothetical protein
VSAFAAALATLRDARASGAWARYLEVPDVGAEQRPRSGHAPGSMEDA